MKLPEMKTGLTISALVHAALLLWGLISFAARPLEAKPNDALPVDIISDKQFSEITKGVKNGAKDKPPAPLVEKVGDPKPVEDSTRQGHARRKSSTPPRPTRRRRPPRSRRRSRRGPSPKRKSRRRSIRSPRRLKKEEAKKKAEEKAKAKAAAAAGQAAAAVRSDQDRGAARQARADAAGLGRRRRLSPRLRSASRTASAAQLSQSEIDALRKRLGECWNPPAGARDGGQLKVVLRVLFKPDATVATPPQLVAATASPFGPAMAESAKRAILTCQPFTMLRADHYQLWKDIEITFDPREMFGG